MSEFERAVTGQDIISESERRTGIPMYHVEGALRDFASVLEQRAVTDADFQPNTGKRTGVLRGVLEAFTNREIDNFDIVHTPDGVAFPVTSIDVTAFAREMYHKYHPGQELPSPKPDQPSANIEEEFIFGSFPDIQNLQSAHPFQFIEEAMRQTVRGIGTIIQDLEAGREPIQKRITTFGAPVQGQWGEITPEYTNKVVADPLGTLAQTYSEAISARLSQDQRERARTKVRLYGHSMGGVLALKTAQELDAEGIATQDPTQLSGTDPLPSLHVLIDSAPGMHPSLAGKEKFSGWGGQHWSGGFPKVLTGFFKDIGRTIAHERSLDILHVPDNERAFLDAVQQKIESRAENRITALTPDQRVTQDPLKKKATTAVILALGQALSVDDQPIKVDMRYGTRDFVSNSAGMKLHTWRRYFASERPVKTTHNIRRWPIKAEGHVLPWFHKTEMNAWTRSVDILANRGVKKF